MSASPATKAADCVVSSTVSWRLAPGEIRPTAAPPVVLEPDRLCGHVPFVLNQPEGSGADDLVREVATAVAERLRHDGPGRDTPGNRLEGVRIRLQENYLKRARIGDFGNTRSFQLPFYGGWDRIVFVREGIAERHVVRRQRRSIVELHARSNREDVGHTIWLQLPAVGDPGDYFVTGPPVGAAAGDALEIDLDDRLVPILAEDCVEACTVVREVRVDVRRAIRQEMADVPDIYGGVWRRSAVRP